MELIKQQAEQQDTVAFCAVCQDEAPSDAITFSCTHTFHKKCIESYYKTLSHERQQELTCILCNQHLTPEDYTKIDLEISPEEVLMARTRRLNLESALASINNPYQRSLYVDHQHVVGQPRQEHIPYEEFRQPYRRYHHGILAQANTRPFNYFLLEIGISSVEAAAKMTRLLIQLGISSCSAGAIITLLKLSPVGMELSPVQEKCTIVAGFLALTLASYKTIFKHWKV